MATRGKPFYPEPVCRKRPSRWLKKQILEAQGFVCLSCDRSLFEVEFDHVVPLGLMGDNKPGNWAALCPKCHRKKTASDLRAIAKAKRLRRREEATRAPPDAGAGASAEASAGAHGAAKRGFDRRYRKHINGVVTRRCACARCRGT